MTQKKPKLLSSVIAAFLVVFFISTKAPAAEKPATLKQPRNVEVFVSGRDGYHTYRIPALIVTEKGALLAFCEGRRKSRSE